jgi:chromosomal replication initiation ATPase DnaA
MRTHLDPAILKELAEALVCGAYHVSHQELAAKSRPRRISWARHVLYWLVEGTTRFDMSDVARVLARERTSVLFGVQAVNDARQVYPMIRAETDALLSEIQARFEKNGSAQTAKISGEDVPGS